jgi:hypothetical protein
MKKTILTVFASALLAGSMIPAAIAGEHHRHIARTYRTAPVVVAPSYLNSNAEYRAPNAQGWSDPRAYWQERDEAAMTSGPAGH